MHPKLAGLKIPILHKPILKRQDVIQKKINKKHFLYCCSVKTSLALATTGQADRNTLATVVIPLAHAYYSFIILYSRFDS